MSIANVAPSTNAVPRGVGPPSALTIGSTLPLGLFAAGMATRYAYGEPTREDFATVKDAVLGHGPDELGASLCRFLSPSLALASAAANVYFNRSSHAKTRKQLDDITNVVHEIKRRQK